MQKLRHNLLVLNGYIEAVEPLARDQARRWDLRGYAVKALMATVCTDAEVYGGRHQVLITSRHALQTLAAYIKGRREGRPIHCTIVGWLYSRGDAALPIAGDITFHIPPEELAPEKIEALLRESNATSLAPVGAD